MAGVRRRAAQAAVLGRRLFVPESWDQTCVPDENGKVANPHARRLRRQPVTLDQAGKKKPHVRKQLPRQEQVAHRGDHLDDHRPARPPGRAVRAGLPPTTDGVLADCWLHVQWPFGDDKPGDYWRSDLHADTPLTDLVQFAESRRRIEHDYRELKTGLGLDHFEGRSWIGWHRPVTLTATAQLFLTQLRLADPEAAGQP